MNGEEEIKIVISADTSELDKALDKTVKNTEKNTKKLEKSFDGLREDVEKLKQGFNFNQTKNSGLNGLTKQFDKLKQTATKVASSIQKSLSKAFNITGKVSVKEDVQVDKTSGTSTDGSQVLGDVLTGSALGSKLQHGMAQMGKTVGDTIRRVLPESFGKGLKESEGLISSFANKMIAIIDKITSTNFDLEIVNTKKLSQDLSILNLLSGMCEKAVESLREVNLEADSFDLEKAKEETKALQSMINKMKTLSEDLSIEVDLTSLENTLQALELLDRNLQEASQTGVNPKTLLVFEGVVHKINTSVSELRTNFSTMAQETNNKINILNNSLRSKLNTALKMAGNQAKLMIVQFKNFKVVKTFDNLTAKVRKFGNALIQSVAGVTFKDLQKNCQNLISKFKNIGKSAKKMGTDTKQATGMMKSGFMGLTSVLAPYLSIYAVFAGLKNSITSFVNMGETLTKFNTVFGEMSDSAMEWADGLSSSVAVSKSELLDGSSNIMAIGKSMGLTTEKAYEFATSLSGMAVDLNSFNNIEDGLDRIRSGILGEYEALKSVGIVLTEETVKNEMLARGMDTTSNSAKMLTRQMLIQKQMMASGAFGNAEREAQGLSAQLKMLKYNFQALGTAIGSVFGGLLQVVVPVLNKIVSAITVAFNKIASVINQIFGFFGIKVGGGSSGGIGSVIGDAIGDMNTSLGNAGAGSGDLADNLADGAKSAKEIAKGLMGIDQINNLTSPSDNKSSGGSGSSGTGGNGGTGLDGLGNIGDSLVIDGSVVEENETIIGELARKIGTALQFIGENFKIGWDKTSSYVMDAIERLKGAYVSLGQAIEENLMGFANNGGARLIQAIGEVAGSLTGLAMNIGASVVEMVAGLVSHLNPQNNPITRFFIDSLSTVLENVSSFAQSFGEWWNKIVDGGLGHFVNACGDLVMLVGGVLCEALGTAIGWIESFFNSWIGQAIIEGLAGAIDLVATALEKLCGWFAENREVLYGFAIGVLIPLAGAFVIANASIIAIIAVVSALVVAIGWLWDNWDDIWKSCTKAIDKAFKSITKTVGKIKDKVVSIFNQIYDKVSDVVSDIWDEFKDKFPNLADIVEDVFSNVKNIVEKYFDNVKTIIKAVIDVVKALFKGDFSSIGGIVKDAFEKVKSNTQSILDSIKGLIQARLDAIKLVFSTIWNAISSTVKSVWNGISSTAQSVWNGISSYFSQVLNAIKTTISGVLNGISSLFSGAWNTIKTVVSGTLTGIQNSISTVMNGIKNTISTIVSSISTVFTNGFNNAKNVINTIFTSIKTVITNAINGAKTNISTIVSTISTVFNNGFNSAKNVISTIFNGIKTVITNAINGAKTNVSSVVSGIATVFSNGFNNAKNTISNIFNNIKSVISTPLNSVKSTVSTICSNIGSSFSNGFNNAKNTVSNAINSMKNTISSVMNTVKSTISGAVSKIKSYFNFSWSLPKPKMPKFEAKWSTVFGVKIPTGFNITWHKDGGIFTQPTVLGNHGFGEAGHEAILPLSDFYKKEDERFNKLAQQISKNNTNNQPVSIVLELDGQTLGKVTYNSLETLTKTGKIDLGRLL